MIRFTIMFVVDATTTTPRWQRCYRLQGARSLPKRSEECHLKGGFTMSAIANGTAVSETSRPSVGSPGVFTSRKRGGSASAMNWVALRILTGDRAKYLGLIFAIAFSTFLIAQQSSLFVVVINRTRSFIVDVTDADIWVMAPATRYLDEVFSLKDNDVDRVRSVPGVRWAVPFYKGSARVIAADGQFRQTTLLGVDDASL